MEVVKSPAECPTAAKWQNWDLNIGNLAPASVL